MLEDYNKGVLTGPVIDAALAVARERSIPSVVDPKRRNFFAFSGVTVFKPNAKELEDDSASAVFNLGTGHPLDAGEHTLANTLDRWRSPQGDTRTLLRRCNNLSLIVVRRDIHLLPQIVQRNGRGVAGMMPQPVILS